MGCRHEMRTGTVTTVINAGGTEGGCSLCLDEQRLERLRTIVDEGIGMQPVLGWDELLDLVEKKLAEDRMRAWRLSEALNDCYRATLPAGTIRASEIERICARREVSNAIGREKATL